MHEIRRQRKPLRRPSARAVRDARSAPRLYEQTVDEAPANPSSSAVGDESPVVPRAGSESSPADVAAGRHTEPRGAEKSPCAAARPGAIDTATNRPPGGVESHRLRDRGSDVGHDDRRLARQRPRAPRRGDAVETELARPRVRRRHRATDVVAEKTDRPAERLDEPRGVRGRAADGDDRRGCLHPRRSGRDLARGACAALQATRTVGAVEHAELDRRVADVEATSMGDLSPRAFMPWRTSIARRAARRLRHSVDDLALVAVVLDDDLVAVQSLAFAAQVIEDVFLRAHRLIVD